MVEEAIELFALLIGINYYFPNKLPEGDSYGHLHGCVNDVEQMESFLKTRLGVTDDHIVKLTASHGGENGPIEDPSMWPTYENIVGGFQHILEHANAGDQVIIHYSGHGGRAKSIYPADKKSGGIDEAFVPIDIGRENGRYLRDLELAHLLHIMSDKGLIVTAFLDCCHSGGMTRGEATPRGILEIDTTERPTDSLAADSTDTLLSSWQQLTGETRSAALQTAGGLPMSDDWVVITACRPQELAYEYKFNGVESNGALTYWLINTLQSGSSGLSYKHLHQSVVAQVKAKFSRQRPQLYGDGERAIFGRNTVQAQFAVPVIKVDDAKREVILNAGIVQGVRRGAKFAIFPLNTPDLSDFDSAVGLVTVKQDGATESKASISEVKEGSTLEPNSHAVLVNPASVRLRSYVRLQTSGNSALPEETQKLLKKAHIEADFGGFLEWVGEETADFIVAANNKGFYEIWDEFDEVIPRINPPLALAVETSAAKVIERLIHLTRYRNVQQLLNNDSRSKDTPNFTFEWIDVPIDHVFSDGDVAKLRVRNDSPTDVEITLLELAHDWRIEQVYPDDAAESYTFAPGEEDILEFDLYIDGDEDDETSIFKLFATIEGTNFRMLELPTLDQPFQKRGETRQLTNDLEELLSQVVETQPPTRGGRLRSSASRQWVTAQLELRVRRD